MPIKRDNKIIDLDQEYWTERYENQQVGWDIGHVSTPIKNYIDQLVDKDIKVLIPGAGNAYEAEYLWEQGFSNVFVVDLSVEPLNNLKSRVPDFPAEQLLQQDFFDLDDQFDLILEQTFFCALNPSLRSAYVQKMHGLLKPSGKLVGLLFNIPLYDDHPPFGGHQSDYKPLFESHFRIDVMEESHNSIEPRMGSELFIKMIPKEV